MPGNQDANIKLVYFSRDSFFTADTVPTAPLST